MCQNQSNLCAPHASQKEKTRRFLYTYVHLCKARAYSVDFYYIASTLNSARSQPGRWVTRSATPRRRQSQGRSAGLLWSGRPSIAAGHPRLRRQYRPPNGPIRAIFCFSSFLFLSFFLCMMGINSAFAFTISIRFGSYLFSLSLSFPLANRPVF